MPRRVRQCSMVMYISILCLVCVVVWKDAVPAGQIEAYIYPIKKSDPILTIPAEIVKQQRNAFIFYHIVENTTRSSNGNMLELRELPSLLSMPFYKYIKSIEELQKSKWVVQLSNFLQTVDKSISPQVNIVFGDYDHRLLVWNWITAALIMLDPPLHNVMVLSLDDSLCNFLKIRNLSLLCIIVPVTSIFTFRSRLDEWKIGVMVRLPVLRLITYWGYDVASYDSDAILLRNPQMLYQEQLDVHIFSSAGTFPQDVFQRWGFTLCAGALMLRASPAIGKAVLLKVIQDSDLLKKEPQLTSNMALVLLHDFLYGKGIQCGGPLKHCVLRHKEDLQRCLTELRREEGKQSCVVQLPRYVRVNTLKTDVASVITLLEQDGYVLCDYASETLQTHFSIDPVLPDLLIFHPSVTLTEHLLYRNSHIILQDKASCLPAFLLAPPPGSRVIDCCAAPGNKTIHLASIMKNKGWITAFDKDQSRFKVLKRRLRSAGATCVVPILSDILEINPEEYKHTEYILVDPSCSGSGIVNRLSYHSNEVSSRRLAKLASFQFKVLKHVLSFPSVKRVVYSTCSVHKEENELVVHKALQEFKSKFELEEALPEWVDRGLPLFAGGEKCLRAGPRNGTNGFFIAVFVRRDICVHTPQFAVTENSRQECKQKKRKRQRRKQNFPITTGSCV